MFLGLPDPSVADPGCFFSSRIPDPDFYPSWIPDLGSKNSNKRGGLKKFVIIIFFVVTNFTKMNIILFMKCWRKKFAPIFKELLKFLPKKFSLCSQIYGFGIRDPRSGKKPIPDPGSMGQKGTGSRIRIRNNSGSRSVSQRYGSGSFYHQAKIEEKKTWFLLFFDFSMTFNLWTKCHGSATLVYTLQKWCTGSFLKRFVSDSVYAWQMTILSICLLHFAIITWTRKTYR